jgi:uncharacterized protein (TIGR02466 family)
MATDQTTYSHVFGSPIMIHRWPDSKALNARLIPAILAESERTPGAGASNVGGWHSTYGKLEFCGEAGATLITRIREMCDRVTAQVMTENGHQPRRLEWTLEAWANVNRRGHFNRIHNHPGSTWSGTYYVDDGMDEASKADAAPIQFFDPCGGHAATFLQNFVTTNFTWQPEPGSMIFFPSYLAHMVFPHQGDRPRISIAFNLRRVPFP